VQKLKSHRNLVLIDAKTGKVDRSFPDTGGGLYRGDVTGVIADGHGGWYIAGGFARVGGVKRPGLAHLNRDGTLDRRFVPDLPKGSVGVQSVAFGDNSVYANTVFSVIAVNAKTGKHRWSTRVGPIDGIAYGYSGLYIGGSITKVDGVHRRAVAALDPSTGKPKPWRVGGWGGEFPPTVSPIAIANGNVYLGGGFTRIGGVPVSCDVAAVSAETGRTTWVPKKQGACSGGSDVESIIVSHGQVLTGSYHGGFVAIDIHTGRVLPWSHTFDNAAYPLAVSGNTVYFGGRPGSLPGGFSRVGGKAVNNLAAVVLPSGKLKNWHPKLAKCVYVADIAVSGRKVLVAGGFTNRSCE
jgi:hypothetical protein